MKILVLSKDATLFDESRDVFGDTRKRHKIYAFTLRERYPKGEIRIITYSIPGKHPICENVGGGLTLYGTNSSFRWAYVLGILKRLPAVLHGGWRPDVITVQTPWEEGTIGYLIARLLGARFLPQLHFDLFRREWRREHILNHWRGFLACRIFHNSHGIRVVCEALREKLAAEVKMDRRKIHVVPVGVNFNPVLSNKHELRERIIPRFDSERVLLFVGRFHAQKNLESWIEVAETLANRIAGLGFVMAGDGPEMPAIRARINAGNYPSRFRLLGQVGHQRLPEVYACADLLLLSSHYEGFGRVIVEANLTGIPVVSTACTGPEDIIVDGETGFLLPCGDVSGMVERCSRLLADPVMRAEFGRRGRVMAEEKFSLEKLSSDLIDCWETVLRTSK